MTTRPTDLEATPLRMDAPTFLLCLADITERHTSLTSTWCAVGDLTDRIAGAGTYKDHARDLRRLAGATADAMREPAPSATLEAIAPPDRWEVEVWLAHLHPSDEPHPGFEPLGPWAPLTGYMDLTDSEHVVLWRRPLRALPGDAA